MKKYPGILLKQNVRIHECQNNVCTRVSFLARGILGSFGGRFCPRSFRGPGTGRIGPHPELFILASQGTI